MSNLLRDKNGRFAKGNQGFWKGKERLLMRGENNCRWVEKIKNNCLQCNKEITSTKVVLRKFCSHSCRAKYYFTGNKNPRWKGGIDDKEKVERGLEKYRKWRLSIFQRDRFTCKMCGHRSIKSKTHGDKISDIHAHHITLFHNHNNLKYDVNNGITLCVNCHRKTYGKEKLFAMEFKNILNDYMLNNPKG